MIQTNRCVINSLLASDVDSMVELQTNEDVYRFLGGPKDERAVRADFEASAKRGFHPHSWAIRYKDSDVFIGYISLSEHHDGDDTELSYLLLPNWWGQGFATEACRAVIEFALSELGLPRVIAETQSANLASVQLLERLGMQKERIVERFGEDQSIYTTDLIGFS